MEIYIPYLLAAGALVVGVFTGNFLQRSKANGIIKQSETRASDIIKKARRDGENIKKDKILQAKERFIELKGEHEKVIFQRENKVSEIEKRLRDKESRLSNELNKNKDLNRKLDAQEEQLKLRLEKLDKKMEVLSEIQKQNIEKLEQIANYSADEAKKELVNSLKDKAKAAAMEYTQQKLEEAKLTVQQEAKKIIINTIQRIGTEEAIENCVSVFNIESDDIKGRIIGREGRNIRALESATGVEVIVDDTPEAIILSCFDPVRREIARLSMHKLVSDGRIHPARIEEVVQKTKRQIENEIVEVGKRTVIDLGIHGLHPELIRIVGRMKYRSSYGQNLL